MVKLYGFSGSTCTRLVALICKEKDVPYELTSVNLAKGEQKATSHTAIQPFGQVPYIDDDGFILYESRAIARYLSKKYPNQGTSLTPSDPKAEALFEQAASIEIFNFTNFVQPIVFEKVFKLRRGLQTDEARVTELLASLQSKMDAYEVILSKQKYLASDSVTLADLYHLPYGTAFYGLGGSFAEVFDSRPSLLRWWKDISSRPAWLAIKDGA
ncbi:glutathione S-transferase [Suillus fuscotomentosus]|uniref:glutathione transferase n=1 Tax=Suillus fuscotomentosus TaxID=1912939 RepID=A0AAD4E728_9AGAM|nr:glutathione S-transferase [Suillus fuscotomentosus]KAG1900940.1 glutathione S-transferase [Suillus fuscotomentosus]